MLLETLDLVLSFSLVFVTPRQLFNRPYRDVKGEGGLSLDMTKRNRGCSLGARSREKVKTMTQKGSE